jgi:beta-aspartyl-peptidase (threonine type)
MAKVIIAVHGGAGPDSKYIRENLEGYEAGIKEALERGYALLSEGGSAVDAVEAAVRELENDPLFNAGKGSALNKKGEVEMDASIMNGENLQAGAVSIVRKVKNPVSLARYVMEHTEHVFVSAQGAIQIAQAAGLKFESEADFVTPYQYNVFKEQRDSERAERKMQSLHGTVGAVAMDRYGNLAAATSTGGASYCEPGRVSDSCIPGAGCYANNQTCAISATGDGEIIIRGVVAHTISSLIELRSYNMWEACELVVHQRNKQLKLKGDVGVIGIDRKGNIGMCFNSERMHRGILGEEHPLVIKTYRH